MLGAATMLLCAQPGLVDARANAADTTICVVCTDPDQTYRCSALREDGTPGNSGYQFLCISEIAREMGHRSCAVRRQNIKDCDGIEKVVSYRENSPADTIPGAVPRDPAISPGDNTGVPADAAGGDTAGNDGNDEEPKTLLELTDQTVKNSQEQIKKTGETISGATKATGRKISDAAKKTGSTVGGAVKKTGEMIGGAAKSTYHCVTSLFTDCF